MLTAVKLRRDPGLIAGLVHGRPTRTVNDIALFEPDQLVAYMIKGLLHTRVFVFRTRSATDTHASKLPGVHPRAQLLLDTRTVAAAARLRNLLLHCARAGIVPESLSDDFWARLGVLLNGRLSSRGSPHLLSLLRHEAA